MSGLAPDPEPEEQIPEPPALDSQDAEAPDDFAEAVKAFFGRVTALPLAPRNAVQVIASAQAQTHNTPGMCLQWSRERALIPSRWPTASLAGRNCVDLHRDRNPRPGSYVFWIGGTPTQNHPEGAGHIAPVMTGPGAIRSTDAGGRGIVATRSLAWFDANWPSLEYLGWADNVNGMRVPGVIETDWLDEMDEDKLRDVIRDVVGGVVNGDQFQDALAQKVQQAVWAREMTVENLQKEKVKKSAAQIIRETWENLKKHSQ